MNLYLETDSSKCGEIFLSNSGNFIISCDICNEKFVFQNIFSKHVLENHLSDDFSDFNYSKESISFDNIEDKDFIETDVVDQIINQYDKIYGAEALYQANGSIDSKYGITLINENELIEVLDEYEDILIEPYNTIKTEISEDITNNFKNEINESITYNFNNENDVSITNTFNKDVDDGTSIVMNYKNSNPDDPPEINADAEQTVLKRKNSIEDFEQNVDSSRTTQVSDEIFVCGHCGANFLDKADLNAHYIVHKVHNKCTFCNKTYTKVDALKMHELKHLNPFQCSFCEKTFFKKHMLQEHENIHLGIKPHICEFCPATFTSRTNLKIHRNRHLNVRPYSCNYCDKTFVATTERKMHERAHRGEKPAVCDICGIGFINTTKLNEHKKRHTNIRDFQCDLCTKAFYSKHQLDQHKVCHITEKSFECGECNAKFKRKKNLLQHYRTHASFKHFKCDICNQEFNQSSSLQNHMKKHKNEILTYPDVNNIQNEEITHNSMIEFDENETIDSVDQFIGDVDKIITSSILIDEQTLINHIL